MKHFFNQYPMPPRKKQTEDPQNEETPNIENEVANSTEKPSMDETKTKVADKSESNNEDAGGQLFFSTDGSEPEKEEQNPFLEEENSKPKTESKVNEETSVEGEDARKEDQGGQQNPPRNHPNNKPNRGPHPNQQKKQNWQDKKKQRNKQRQKFKKPKRLPYEETEAKPLELGELLENESIQSEEGVSALAENFNSSDQKPVELDELLALSLQELKDKIADYDLDLGQAPLREEIFDSLLAKCLEDKTPVIVSGILQVMEDGHALLLQQKEDYRLKSQCPFDPETIVKKYGLKNGQNVRGYIRAKLDGSTCPIFLQVDQVMGGDPEEASRVTPFTELIPYYPLERIYLETDEKAEWDNVAMRVVDLVSPVGFGQRGLIVAPPRTGKTVLQQGIARALRVNNPN